MDDKFKTIIVIVAAGLLTIVLCVCFDNRHQKEMAQLGYEQVYDVASRNIMWKKVKVELQNQN